MIFSQFTKEQAGNLLDNIYDILLHGGLPNTKSCYELADEYLQKSKDSTHAAKNFIHCQILKCGTSGFITGLGGILTMAVAVPSDLAAVWYIQLRMIAVLAIMGGYDPSDDYVRTLAYICLTGNSVTEVCRTAGIRFGNKLTLNTLKKLPGSILTKINQKIGFRFITKFGEKGIINLGKVVPIVGGFIGGGVDAAGTKLIAAHAYKIFMLNKIE